MLDKVYIRANLRKGLYALVAAVLPILVFAGIVTDVQAAAVGGFATAIITLVFALYKARQQGAPLSRQIVYAVAAAASGVGVAFGIWSPGLVEVTLPAVAAFLALFLADVSTGEEDDFPEVEPRRAYPAE